MNRIVATVVLLLMMPCTLCMGRDWMTRSQYIEKYKDIAIDQMVKKGIPASITLAQGCLESANGNSELAVCANNHFGIKCHSTWDGDTIGHEAETGIECFRKYDSVMDSYSDHSDFLRYRDRYAFLFELDRTDYKGWAYGLRQAGYATDPSYPKKLIRIIEEHRLFEYDVLEDSLALVIPPTPMIIAASTVYDPEKESDLYRAPLGRQVYEQNGVPYIISEENDTYGFLAREYNLFKSEILNFNDLQHDERLAAGTRVYLSKKKTAAARHLDKHVVEEGDTMYDLSQRYAVQLKYLCQYNNMRMDDRPVPGTIIRLQKPYGR